MTQPSHRPFSLNSRTLVFLFAALLAACGADQPADSGRGEVSAPAESEGNGPTFSSEWNGANGTSPTDVTPENESGAVGEEGRVEALQNCVYIDYCNEPGYWGTVCRAKRGCASDAATRAECDADVRAVCGKATAPIDLRWY